MKNFIKVYVTFSNFTPELLFRPKTVRNFRKYFSRESLYPYLKNTQKLPTCTFFAKNIWLLSIAACAAQGTDSIGMLYSRISLEIYKELSSCLQLQLTSAWTHEHVVNCTLLEIQ